MIGAIKPPLSGRIVFACIWIRGCVASGFYAGEAYFQEVLFMRQAFLTAVVLGAGGMIAATSGLASASSYTGSYTFSNPASQTPGSVSGLTTVTKFFVPTFGTTSSGTYTGGGGYDNPAGGFPQPGPTSQALANSETFFANNTFTVSAANASNGGPAYTFTLATGTTTNPNPVTTVEAPPTGSTANDILQPSNPFYPGNPNNGYAAKADVAYMVDQQGYIDIATPGTYTFGVNAGDDILALYIGGSGGYSGAAGTNPAKGPSGTGSLGATGIGGGTLVASGNYGGGVATGLAGQVGTYPVQSSVDFTQAGLYHFEDYYYQGYGGQSAQFTITSPAGAVAPTFFTSAVTPEPASMGLLAVGAIGMLLVKRRKAHR